MLAEKLRKTVGELVKTTGENKNLGPRKLSKGLSGEKIPKNNKSNKAQTKALTSLISKPPKSNDNIQSAGLVSGLGLNNVVAQHKEFNRDRALKLQEEQEKLNEVIEQQKKQQDEYENDVIPGYRNAIEALNEKVSQKDQEIVEQNSKTENQIDDNLEQQDENKQLKAEVDSLVAKIKILEGDRTPAEIVNKNDEEKDELMLQLIKDLKSKLDNIGV